jgi:HlyD family secretion protein
LRESESIVPPGEPLLELGDPGQLEIVTDLLSTDAVRVSAGARATIEQWGEDIALDATVRRIEPAGFTKISALGVEEQRVKC